MLVVGEARLEALATAMPTFIAVLKGKIKVRYN